jgi:hypothetical protein
MKFPIPGDRDLVWQGQGEEVSTRGLQNLTEYKHLLAVLAQGDVAVEAGKPKEKTPNHIALAPIVSFAEHRAFWDKPVYGQVVEDVRRGLNAITQTAVMAHNKISGRDINGYKHAIEAHMDLLRVNERGTPFHVRNESPMEQMICAELKTAMHKVYAREKADGQGFEVHDALQSLAKFGTYNADKEFSNNARHTVDSAFVEIVSGMDQAARTRLEHVLERNAAPEFAHHVHDILEAGGIQIAPPNRQTAFEPQALTL